MQAGKSMCFDIETKMRMFTSKWYHKGHAKKVWGKKQFSGEQDVKFLNLLIAIKSGKMR